MEEVGKAKATRGLFILAAFILAVSLIGSGFALLERFSQTNVRRQEQTRINLAVCKASASDRTALRALVIQADTNLGTRKSAGYTYYRDHPDELRAAHQQAQFNLTHYLPAIKCRANGTPFKPSEVKK